MSDLPPPAVPLSVQPVADQSALPSDRIVTPQTMIALLAMVMAYTIVAKILWNGSETLQSQVLMLAQNLVVAIVAYYFGSSKGSSDKDAKPPAVPVVVAPAAAPPELVAALNKNTAAAELSAAASTANTSATTQNTTSQGTNP